MSLTMTETELPSPSSTTSSSGELSPHRIHERGTYKKSNKPMMEKKRRARINSCLTQIKSLVLQAMKKDNSQYSKLEKADILELTVRHLRNVQRYQNSALTPLPDAMTKYRAGFNECANEVVRYLGESQGVNDEARTRIISHLASILTPINSLQLQQTPILPAPLQLVKQEALDPPRQQLNPQQHNTSPFLNSSSQQLSIDNNNNRSIISYPTFLSTTGKTINTNQTMPLSPTAFQCPVTTTVNAPIGIQIPCLATNAFVPSTTQLQFVPNSLSYGQVAFVLAPQGLSAANVYTTQHGSRPHVGIQVLTNQPQCGTQVDVSKYHVSLIDGQTSRSHRQNNSSFYQRTSSPLQPKSAPDGPQNVALTSSSSSQSSNPKINQSNIVQSCQAPSTTVTSNIVQSFQAPSTTATSNIVQSCHSPSTTVTSNSDGGSVNFTTTTTTTDCCVNVVTTTSTWRPW